MKLVKRTDVRTYNYDTIMGDILVALRENLSTLFVYENCRKLTNVYIVIGHDFYRRSAPGLRQRK